MSVVDDAGAMLLAEFRAWLVRERGLAPETVRCYCQHAGKFLGELPDPLDAAVRQLDSGRITAFMVDYCRGRNTWSAKTMATSLRALLRFLHVSGRTPVGLAAAVPAVAGWRLAALPRGLDAAVVARLLGSCDRATVVGRRDYAILTLLARLGLRGAEVAGLRLGDIDWRGGEVTVHGKGNRIDRLPLPADVGDAIAGYLTAGRPACATRTVFCTVRAPHRRLTAAAVRGIMGQACRRAGLPRVGAHRLRHTLATEMLRAGSVAAAGGAGAAASQPAVDHDLRDGRRERAAAVGAPVADGSAVMIGLRAAAEDYLAMRRALGFKLTTQARQLRSFVDYCENHGSDRITSELALAWATHTPHDSSHDAYLARRLMVVRIFARHLKTLDPATEIPPEDALPHHKCRIVPYLYGPGEIVALIAAAGGLQPPLRAATWQTLIGLLAVTGMRKSEACRLDDAHVDLDAATLVVLDSKFGKSRRLFLHSSTVAALADYRRRRDQWCPKLAESSFFVSTRGTRLDVHNIGRTFARLLDTAVITAPPRQRRPRLHDVRHSFTVATLTDFYRDGGDVQARLPVLSTWLGHVDPKSTYWYLQQVPQLLTLAADRLEASFGVRS